MSNITDEDREKTRKEMMLQLDNEYLVESYELIGRRFSIDVIYFPSFDKPKKLFYLPRKRNTRTNEWIDLNEPCDTREEALNIIEAEKAYEKKSKMTKITEDIIQKYFIEQMNWWDDAYSVPDDNGEELIVHYYCSPCNRYVLTRDSNSNICDETGVSWNLHIDNSDMDSIGNVSVNYVEEVNQLMDIFKNY
jgi:hypothetical protein